MDEPSWLKNLFYKNRRKAFFAGFGFAILILGLASTIFSSEFEITLWGKDDTLNIGVEEKIAAYKGSDGLPDHRYRVEFANISDVGCLESVTVKYQTKGVAVWNEICPGEFIEYEKHDLYIEKIIGSNTAQPQVNIKLHRVLSTSYRSLLIAVGLIIILITYFLDNKEEKRKKEDEKKKKKEAAKKRREALKKEKEEAEKKKQNRYRPSLG